MEVKDVNSANFHQNVIEKSHSLPVVVDFWAPWCGPCRFLGPVIEALAEEADGQWELVKLNTDENQELSRQYKIRGIPAVKMFYKGEVVAEFTGALAKHQIENWLSEHLPDERLEQLTAIKKQLTDNNANALPILENFVAQHPDLEEARILLAVHRAVSNPTEARKMVAQITLGHKYYEQAEDVRNLTDLMECNEDGNPTVEEKIVATQEALKNHNQELALQNLIDAVMLDKHYCNELPRRATVALFHVLGEEHPLTKKFRRRFDMALY